MTQRHIFLIGSEQSKHLRKEWLHVVIDNKIDTWMFLGMRSTLLSLYACLYLLGSHGVTPHHALYLQLFRSRHFPYIINKSVKTALIKQSSLKPYTLNACRLCPPAKISTHGAMHYRVEQLKQNCIGKNYSTKTLSVDISIGIYGIAAYLCGNSLLNFFIAIHNHFGPRVTVIDRIAHRAQHFRYYGLAAADSSGNCGNLHGVISVLVLSLIHI